METPVIAANAALKTEDTVSPMECESVEKQVDQAKVDGSLDVEDVALDLCCEEGIPYFDMLPSDLVVYILNFLGKNIFDVYNVCKAWREVCQDPVVWESLTSNLKENDIRPTDLMSWDFVPEPYRTSILYPASFSELIDGPRLALDTNWDDCVTFRFGPNVLRKLLASVCCDPSGMWHMVSSCLSSLNGWFESDRPRRYKTARTIALPNENDDEKVKSAAKMIVYMSALRTCEMCIPLRFPFFMMDQIHATMAKAFLAQSNALLQFSTLDQLIMCSIFVLSKANQFPCTFRKIITQYKSQPLFKREVYAHIKMPNGIEDSDIIGFYNKVFLPHLRAFVIYLGGSEMSSISKTYPTADGTQAETRVKEFCRHLLLPHYIASQIESTILVAMGNTTLCYNRHHDSIIMCSIYAVCKSSRYQDSEDADTPSVELGIPFQRIVSHYESLPDSRTERYNRVFMGTSFPHADIVNFYNEIYLPEMENALKNLRYHKASKITDTYKPHSYIR